MGIENFWIRKWINVTRIYNIAVKSVFVIKNHSMSSLLTYDSRIILTKFDQK